MSTALEILMAAKSRDERNIGAVSMLDTDPVLARLVSVFQAIGNCIPDDPNPDEECPEATPGHLQIRWVWSRLNPDPVSMWIEASGLPDAPHIRRACYVAIDTAMVYSDGCMAGWVSAFLKQRAGEILFAKMKGQAPKSNKAG